MVINVSGTDGYSPKYKVAVKNYSPSGENAQDKDD